MPIEAICPNASCGKRYSVPESANGRSVRCKGCGETFVVSRTDDLKPAISQSKTSDRPSAAPTELTGIGRFVVRKKLGAGAFGTVYRAYDPQLDREVALKVPNPGTLDSPQRVERFLREAKAAARLRHPHIVPVFDAGFDSDRYYIASAFINGKPLADTIEEGGTDYDRAARLTRELAEALAYAHTEGVVHRDVKPANAMVDDNDRLHLMDFGLAARAEDTGEAKLTKDGSVMGTPAYMSPEQAKGQKGEAKPATDQYAVGVVLYELLTGEVPFKGPVAIVIHNALHTEPEKPSRLRKDVPRDLETICLKAMSKAPENRYPSCQELADDLRRWLEGEPITARRLNPVARAARWIARRPTQAGLVAMVFVAMGLFASAIAIDDSRRDAVDQHEKAQTARDAAQLARRQAETALDNEAEAKRIAQDAKQDEEKARHRAENAAERVARLEYGRKVGLAYRLRQDGYIDSARELLAECRTDLRNFEWGYVNGLCQRGMVSLSGHTSDLNAASISSDGRRVLTTATGEKGVRVWDARTGNQLRIIGANSWAGVKAISGDGTRLAVANEDHIVRVWKTEVGIELRQLKHGARVMGLALSEDGRRAVTACEDRTARVWDVETGIELRTMRDPGGIFAVAISADGKRVVTSGNPKRVATEPTRKAVRVWDVDSGAELCALEQPGGAFPVALSGNGKRVVIGHHDRTVRVWDATTGAEIRALKQPGTVIGVAVSGDGGRVVIARMGTPVKVWDVDAGNELRALDLKGATSRVAISGDGRWVVTTGNSPVATVWDLDAQMEASELVKGHAMYTAAVSGNSKRVATGGRSRQFGGLGGGLGRSIQVWDTETGTELPALQHPDQVHGVVLSSDGKRAVTKCNDKAVRVWDIDTGIALRVLKHPESVTGMTLSGDGRRVVTGCQDKVVRVWDADTGAELRALKHSDSLFPVSVSWDGRRVATGCNDKTVRVWDAEIGVEMHKMTHPEFVYQVAISGDGNRVVSWCRDRTVRVWDAGSGKMLHVLKHPDDLFAVAVSRDGKRIATCTSDTQTRIWDGELGIELLALKLPDTPSSWLGFSTDGHRLLSLGWFWEGSFLSPDSSSNQKPANSSGKR